MIPNEAEQNIFLSQRFTFSSKDQQQKWLKNFFEAKSSNWQILDIETGENDATAVERDSKQFTCEAFRDDHEGIQIMASVHEY